MRNVEELSGRGIPPRLDHSQQQLKLAKFHRLFTFWSNHGPASESLPAAPKTVTRFERCCRVIVIDIALVARFSCFIGERGQGLFPGVIRGFREAWSSKPEVNNISIAFLWL